MAAAVPWILLEGLLMGGASIGADKAAGMKLSAAGLLYLAFTTSRVRRASKPAVDEVLVNLLYRAATGRTVPSWATEVDDREDEDEEDKELQRRFDEAMTKGKHAAEPPSTRPACRREGATGRFTWDHQEMCLSHKSWPCR